MLHVWYIYLHLGDFVRVNVGKYSETMEHMGWFGHDVQNTHGSFCAEYPVEWWAQHPQ